MKSSVLVLPLLCALMVCTLSCAGRTVGEPIRGLVVDVSDGILWLGLPSPVSKGTVFDVKLVGGAEVIARAEVLRCTPDSPFVAQARYAIERPGIRVPVGAYVEAGAETVATRWEELGYEPLRLERRDATPLALEVGAFFPTRNRLADETSDAWFALELSYRLARIGRCETRFVAGYSRGNGDFEILGIPASRTTSIYPVLLDVKMRSPGQGWFARVGTGAFLVDDKTTIAGTSTSDNGTRFGWRAGIGYEGKGGKFAQLAYTDVSSTDIEGLQLTLGTGF